MYKGQVDWQTCATLCMEACQDQALMTAAVLAQSVLLGMGNCGPAVLAAASDTASSVFVAVAVTSAAGGFPRSDGELESTLA